MCWFYIFMFVDRKWINEVLTKTGYEIAYIIIPSVYWKIVTITKNTNPPENYSFYRFFKRLDFLKGGNIFKKIKIEWSLITTLCFLSFQNFYLLSFFIIRIKFISKRKINRPGSCTCRGPAWNFHRSHVIRCAE